MPRVGMHGTRVAVSSQSTGATGRSGRRTQSLRVTIRALPRADTRQGSAGGLSAPPAARTRYVPSPGASGVARQRPGRASCPTALGASPPRRIGVCRGCLSPWDPRPLEVASHGLSSDPVPPCQVVRAVARLVGRHERSDFVFAEPSHPFRVAGRHLSGCIPRRCFDPGKGQDPRDFASLWAVRVCIMSQQVHHDALARPDTRASGVSESKRTKSPPAMAGSSCARDGDVSDEWLARGGRLRRGRRAACHRQCLCAESGARLRERDAPERIRSLVVLHRLTDARCSVRGPEHSAGLNHELVEWLARLVVTGPTAGARATDVPRTTFVTVSNTTRLPVTGPS